MGDFVAGPLSLAAAEGFDEWILRLRQSFDELVAAGRTPDIAGLDAVLDLTEKFRVQVKNAADQARRAGEQTFMLRAPMTPAEQRSLADTGTALQNYMEVLTLRGVVDATPSPETAEALMILGSGQLEA